MKAIFGILITLFSILVSALAIIWVASLWFGFGGALITSLILAPIFFFNILDQISVGVTDSQRREDWRRRRQWRGY